MPFGGLQFTWQEGPHAPRAREGFEHGTNTAPFPATTLLGAAVLDRPRFLTPGRHRSPAGPAAADDPYNLWMITTTAEALAASLPDSSALDLPDGLTVDDALRIAEAVASTLAESTRHVYGHGWRQVGALVLGEADSSASRESGDDLRLLHRASQRGRTCSHPRPGDRCHLDYAGLRRSIESASRMRGCSGDRTSSASVSCSSVPMARPMTMSNHPARSFTTRNIFSSCVPARNGS